MQPDIMSHNSFDIWLLEIFSDIYVNWSTYDLQYLSD